MKKKQEIVNFPIRKRTLREVDRDLRVLKFCDFLEIHPFHVRYRRVRVRLAGLARFARGRRCSVTSRRSSPPHYISEHSL